MDFLERYSPICNLLVYGNWSLLWSNWSALSMWLWLRLILITSSHYPLNITLYIILIWLILFFFLPYFPFFFRCTYFFLACFFEVILKMSKHYQVYMKSPICNKQCFFDLMTAVRISKNDKRYLMHIIKFFDHQIENWSQKMKIDLMTAIKSSKNVSCVSFKWQLSKLLKMSYLSFFRKVDSCH